MATAKKTSTSKSTAIAPRSSGNVISIKEQLAKQAQDLNNRVAPPSGINIGITNAKEFKLPDGRKTTTLDLVIVDFVSANNFYEGSYDPNNISPPACFAIGTNPLQLVPSKNSPNRQADECKSCPMNEFGSNGNGKACKNGRTLAVLPADANADTPLWTLKVSPTALKAFDGYVRSVASAFGMPPIAVVTTVTFDENTDYASLRFGNPTPNENLEACFARQEEARKLLATEPDVSQYAATQKAPARKTANARGRR